jgi:hypothetical protein
VFRCLFGIDVVDILTRRSHHPEVASYTRTNPKCECYHESACLGKNVFGMICALARRLYANRVRPRHLLRVRSSTCYILVAGEKSNASRRKGMSQLLGYCPFRFAAHE